MKVYPLLIDQIVNASPSNNEFGEAIWEMVSNTGPVGQFILLLLFVFSLIVWTIIVNKFFIFRKSKKADKQFLELYSQKSNLASLHITAKNHQNSPIANVFSAGYEELASLLREKYNEDTKNANKRCLINIDGITRCLEKASRIEIAKLETSLTFLATTGNITPFIGLFGTVWGVMMSFHDIGRKGSASIAVVAPGLSEALITTAAGIIAAVPSVMFYNHYVSLLRVLSDELENFRIDFISMVDKNYKIN